MTGLREATRFAWRVRGRTVQPLMHAVLRPRSDATLVRLGSAYGGWWVPEDRLVAGAVAYCAGAGEDISFDLELAQRGIEVWTFDPTPRAIAYVGANGQALNFVPVGWWDREDDLRFYAPARAGDVSHSAVNLQGTSTFFTGHVDTVAAIAARHGHDRLSLVKMDIEGAEYRVIRSMLKHGPKPDVWCIEFDQPQPMRKVIAAVREIRATGYELLHIERWNYTFGRFRP